VINQLDEKIELLNSRIGAYMEKSQAQTLILYASYTILALLVAVVLLVFKAYRIKQRSNTELEKQRDQLIELSRQLEEATHARLMFFTNISHDFRTPLTLIADPVNRLIEDKNFPGIYRDALRLVKRNTNILLRLVNQLLDFRKYENGKQNLVPGRCDLDKQLREWSDSFTSLAAGKQIDFMVVAEPATDYNSVIDLAKIERVYFNLVSNAFKFTPNGGQIKVTLSVITENAAEYIRLTVKDNGIGISPQHIEHIFKRFYMSDYQYAGSGIGLALTKAFVELHGGKIEVESEEGKGSVFTVTIPKTQAGYDTAETSPAIQPAGCEDVTEIIGNASAVPHMPGPEVSPELACRSESLLIMDDNPDIRSYIRSFMGANYTILEADNGKTGLEMAISHVPDIIICDIMMPVMDGLECCKALKTEIRTSHIPVIMLTACALDEQRIIGFETGADSYISKPFNSKVLAARVSNLVKNRKHLRQFFGDHTTLSKESISALDKKFVEKLRRLIQENIPNSSFSVEDMGEQMGMSRVQLYRKIKSLTNYAPNELLRMARLKKAATLLSSSGMSIAEIAYEVGFTSPSYFTKCYKEYFGENPTDFLKGKG
jgi:signal transduction histidine kinase/DNA-binding response OmpR family regulator